MSHLGMADSSHIDSSRRRWWWVSLTGVAVLLGAIGVTIAFNDSSPESSRSDEVTSSSTTVLAVTELPEPGTTTTTDQTPPVASTTTVDSPTTVPEVWTPPPPVESTTTSLADPVQVVPPGITLLVAHAQGVELWSSGGVTSVLTGVDVRVAYPDGRGGVVFQRRTEVFDSLSQDGAPIEWVSEPGAAPVVIADSPTADSLQAVRASAEHPLVFYAEPVPNAEYCDASSTYPQDFDCAEYSGSDLVILDLADGTERRLEGMWGWETTRLGFELGTHLVATTHNPYDDDPNCYGVFTLDEVLANPYGGYELCPIEVGDCHYYNSDGHCDAGMHRAYMTEDDGTVRYIWYDNVEQSGELVTVSALDGSEISRLRLPTDVAALLDTHSTGWSVLNSNHCCPGPHPLFLVAPDGTISDPIDAPTAVIWSVP